MDKIELIKLDPLRMCLVLGLLGVEGGNAHRSFSCWWAFCICGAQQRLSSSFSIPFLGKTLTGSLFLSQVAYFYETCRNVVFQASAPLPNLVEMADEVKNYEGTQTSADRVIT